MPSAGPAPRFVRSLRRLGGPGAVKRIRRQAEMRVDQAWALARWRLQRDRAVPAFDDDPRFALLTVNFSTTRYLKLMLLTLCEQEHLDLVHRIVIVDNRSRDGGMPFLRALSERVPRVQLVENRVFLNHARGMRRAIAALDDVEAGVPETERCNLLLSCDPDVVFRNPETLLDLAAVVVSNDAAFAGELRRHLHPYPEAQASFFVVRRDCYERPDVVPWVNHGSPAYWMQRSIWRAGLTVVDFPSNHGGYVLHRGRTAVAAAGEYVPRHSYAKVESRDPHFMGVPGGTGVWSEIEGRHAHLLAEDDESRLLAHLAGRLAR